MNAPKEPKEKSTKKVLKTILAIVLALVLLFDTVISICVAVYYFSGGQLLNPSNRGSQKEDGVVIAEDYTVRSTTQISDAYKSGSDSGLSEQDKETLKMASAVLDEIIKDDMSDYDKEKAVFDWMCDNLNNENVTLLINEDQLQPDTPYGVLKNKYAVCVGYATTFRLFMQMMDIECKVVHNNDCYHTWDEVKLDDNWYYVDVYSAVDNHDYLYFNMNDEMLSQSQDWDTEYFPAATSLEMNPVYKERTTLDSIYDLPKQIKKDMENNVASRIYEFKTPLSDTDFQQITNLIMYLETMVDTYSNYDTEPSGCEAVTTSEDGITAVYISYLNMNEEDGPQEEETETMDEKMAAAIDKVFDTSSLEAVDETDDDPILYEDAQG